MRLSNFDFSLPKVLIAKRPSKKKNSKVLICKNKEIINFRKIISYFNQDDVLIFNNTKVIPVLCVGKVANRYINLTLLENINENIWKAFIKPAKKIKLGEKIFLNKNLHCTLLDKSSTVTLIRFNKDKRKVLDYLTKHGNLPLPPYTKSIPNRSKDEQFYQTVFAKELGAVASPTAGLHFNNNIIINLKKKKVKIIFTTLHVGMGTFMPISNENIEYNKLHSEHGIITKYAAKHINNAIREKKKIVAVGTTVVRLLESCFYKYGRIKEYNEKTDLFIYPGFAFNVVDELLTNFHLPKSSLFILVSAFAGKNKIKDIYKYAIEKKMKFFSFGDAMLIKKNDI